MLKPGQETMDCKNLHLYRHHGPGQTSFFFLLRSWVNASCGNWVGHSKPKLINCSIKLDYTERGTLYDLGPSHYHSRTPRTQCVVQWAWDVNYTIINKDFIKCDLSPTSSSSPKCLLCVIVISFKSKHVGTTNANTSCSKYWIAIKMQLLSHKFPFSH